MMIQAGSPRLPIRAITCVAGAILVTSALLAPAEAQFWNPFGSLQPRPKQRTQPTPQPQPYNPFSSWFGGGSILQKGTQNQPTRPAVADFSQAPAPVRKSQEAAAAVTTPIVVMGDAMADWLAYGLEEAFAERPEFGIVRKHRTTSGLIRYDPRRDVEWAQVAREIIAAERPKIIVMMVGFHDRQPIRERVPTAKAGRPAAPPIAAAEDQSDPESPEARAVASAQAQNAELERSKQPAGPPTSQDATRATAPAGPLEFQSEAWQAAYIRRIDATIAALRSANVPVFWVGLPPQRNARLSSDAAFLNELFRARAERAGIVYIDIWDAFVDEAGRYMIQGADFEGQIRRLRSGDGIYFTRAGARKLAHYVEREILRVLLNRDTPITLPMPEPTAPQAAQTRGRPLAGPVIPLTASIGGQELLGGGTRSIPAPDPLVNRVLVRGEAITAPPGRADNFAWPRGSTAVISEGEQHQAVQQSQQPVQQGEQTPQPQQQGSHPRPNRGFGQPPAAAVQPPARSKAQPGEAPVQRRVAPRASNDGIPRPPLAITPR